MSLYKDPKSPFYYARIHIKGKCIRRCLGTDDRQEANQAHDELKARLWGESRQSEITTWFDACANWLNEADRSKSDGYTLRKLNTTFPDCDLAELTATSFFPHMPKVTGTFNRYAAIINAILNLAKDHGLIEKPPIIKMKKVVDSRIRWLSKEEWDALYLQLPEHLKPMAKFSVATGLRQKNVTQLRWKDVDLKRKVMWVHADEAKGRKPIGIPLSPVAIEVLKGQEEQHAVYVFIYRGGPISKIKNAWQNAVARAGLGTVTIYEDKSGKKHRKFESDVVYHSLRHTWASWHLHSGTTLPELQALGGWAKDDMRMVMKYSHFAPEHLASRAGNAIPYSTKQADKPAEERMQA